MKPDQWDKNIQEKMQSFRVDAPQKDWDVFEEKLTLAQGEPAQQADTGFDELVFNRLNQFNAPSGKREQHWQLFEKQLHYLIDLRQRLLQYKFIEVAVLTLLLLYVIEAEAPGRAPLSAPYADGQTALNQEETTSVQSGSDLADISSTALVDQTAISPNLSNDDGGVFQASPLVGSTSTLAAALIALENSGEKQLITLPTQTSKETSSENLSTNSILTSSLSPLLVPNPTLSTEVKADAEFRMHISMLGGVDYNRVMTPENLRAGINAFERYSAGYRGGLLVDLGRQDSRLHLGGGLIYTAKQYEVGYKRINGSLLRRGGLTAESISDIELNILNVPVYARWDVWHNKRWSLFAQGGLALQMMLQTNYYAAYPDYFEPLGVNRTPSRYSPLKDRNGGLLEGGSFKENGFFSSHFGLGAERQMAERWSMFFQSRYEHSLGYLSAGLGPTEDRLNTFSLETGIRVRLK